jgi:hypothetical protein
MTTADPTDQELREFLRATGVSVRHTDFIMNDPVAKANTVKEYRLMRAEACGEPGRELSPLEQFDAATARVTRDRGSVYGHPVDNFGRIQALKDQVRDCKDPHTREVLEMLCVKIARLVETPDHIDSFIDIAGYARTGVMCINRKMGFDAPPDVKQPGTATKEAVCAWPNCACENDRGCGRYKPTFAVTERCRANGHQVCVFPDCDCGPPPSVGARQ